MSKNAFTKEQLRSYIERIERLEEEKRALTEDIKQVYAEAKGNGFVTGIIRQVVRDRRKDTVDYQEEQALLELYRAALGMLDEPLSDNARKRAAGQPPEPAEKDSPAPANTQKKAGASSAEAIAAARQEGKDAAIEGQKVIENPYVYGDPRRVAWDEGWCAGSCSDGMDIPEAWRRSKPKKDKKPGAEKADDAGKDDKPGDAP